MIACASASILETTDSSDASGSSDLTRATRSRTSFAAESTSRSGTNSTVIWLTSSRDTDFTVRTPSMPEIESSIGCVICDSVTCGLAPLYTVRTETIGVSILRSEEHTSELQSQSNLVCRLLLEKKKKNKTGTTRQYKRTNKTPQPDLHLRRCHT